MCVVRTVIGGSKGTNLEGTKDGPYRIRSYDYDTLAHSYAHTCIVCPVPKILHVVLSAFLVHLVEHVWDDVLTQCLVQRFDSDRILLVFGYQVVVGCLESMRDRHAKRSGVGRSFEVRVTRLRLQVGDSKERGDRFSHGCYFDNFFAWMDNTNARYHST